MKFLSERHYIDHVPFISVGVISGVFCCLYAILFSRIERMGMGLIHQYPYWFFIISPAFLCLSFLIVQKISPGASGSGIPQVMACIEKSHQHLAPRFLGIRVLIVKITSSILAIFSSAAIGREGPSLQISAVIAHKIGLVAQRLGIQIKTEQLLIAGASSGLAAAFNTPIGGIVYAIEELSHEHLRSFKDVLLLSVVIAGFTAQIIMGNYLYLGYPFIAPSTMNSIAIISVVSLGCGILGSFFSLLLTKLIRWRAQKTFKVQLIIVALIAVALVTAYIFLGERTVFSGKESINFVLFNKGELSLSEILLRFISPLLSSMTGVAGGIFAPSLSAGATIGGYMSQMFDPSLRTILGLSGMISFLTGVTRAPITSFVLVLEMTDRHSSVFPMMFAAMFGSLGAHIIGSKSFYETSVDLIKANEKENL